MSGLLNMKKLVFLAATLTFPLTAFGQGNTLASTIEVYVFPSSGQDASQQSMDEAECYDWAVDNTGSDPFELAEQEQADQQQAEQEMAAAETSGRGSGGRTALRGAAAGAVVGEIVDDDASKGAAYGAAAGAVAGRRRAKRSSAEAQQQAQQGAEAREEATAEDLENFKNAFSVCLEAKEYMVKF
jgi:hypothetical protein